MLQRVDLVFDNTLIGLAGFEYGEEEFDKQVRGKIDLNGVIVLKFPDNIEQIASSFIQGFFKEIIKVKGLRGVEEQVKVISKIENLKQKILSNLQI